MIQSGKVAFSIGNSGQLSIWLQGMQTSRRTARQEKLCDTLPVARLI
ncbi:MAG TPA: hypothetical protein VI248_24125 [Kineosporiaceae bacterium]